LRAWVSQLRCHQWSKNLLLLVPLILAHEVNAPRAVVAAILAVLTFSLVASAVYILNDWIDIPFDRQHPRKRSRPLASNEITAAKAATVACALFGAGIGLSLLLLPTHYVWMLVGYVGLNLVYSLWLKRVAILDVLLLAGFYVYRVIAGAVAVQVQASFWLLAFSMFFFLGLGLMKRFADLVLANANGTNGVAGRTYDQGDADFIRSFGTASSCVAVLVLALYLQSHDVTQLYPHPQYLWLVSPLVLYWSMRAWLVAQRGQMPDDPIVFSLYDPASYVTGALTALMLLLASW
jgi:4-hydroxybenzoate polyprenyltransferase